MPGDLHKRCLLLAAVGVLAGMWLSASAFAQEVRPVAVEPGFLAERKPSGKTEPAKDLSGIFCRPIAQDQFRCLVVNDEAIFVQWATYAASRLTPVTEAGGFIDLVGEAPPGREIAFDDPANVGLCAGGLHSKFNEFDGEAVAWAPGPEGGGTYYVVGSHSCSRGDSEEGKPPRTKLSTHLVARIQMLTAGPKVDLTWRLGPSLRANQAVGSQYNQPLRQDTDGLDIEGAAVIGERLYLGLRAPATEHATVLGVVVRDIFTPAASPGAPVPLSAHRLALGKHVGIRDMATLPDGRLLVLSGPAQGQDLPFGLHVVRPSTDADWATPTPIVTAIKAVASKQDASKAKAEGIAVLGVDGRQARVLVLFEDPVDGALEYRITLPD